MRALAAALSVVLAVPLSAQNLVHYWDFGTDGVVIDEGSAAAGNGALVGGARVTGGALHLDGSSGYVQFQGHLIPTSPPYSVALFVRASGGANAGALRDFISQGAAGGAFFIGAAMDGSSIRAGDGWPAVSGAALIADGEYHHYAVTMSAEGASFYVDGVLASGSAPFAGGSGGTGTRLGRGVGSGGAFFNGSLDEVRVYDDALTAEEVRELALLALRRRPARRGSSPPLLPCKAPCPPVSALHPE